jgi:hypothetical protein
MVTPSIDGIDLFKIAGRSISGWIPSFKTSSPKSIRQPFCSQLEERLLLWLEYNPQVVSYARGDIGPPFAATYRLPLPKHAPFAIGYTFEGKLILASLEIVHRQLFPHLNLRQWSGFIYQWLTQSPFDPTHSGRVTMDHVMKLVTTALERTYEAHETDVRAQTLEDAASLLVLRRDTFRVIDGDGPGHDAPAAEPAGGNQASEAQEEQVDQKTEDRTGSVTGMRLQRNHPKQSNAPFLGWCQLTSSSFWIVAFHRLSVLTVPAPVPSLHTRESSDFHPTNGAKHAQPQQNRDGQSVK